MEKYFSVTWQKMVLIVSVPVFGWMGYLSVQSFQYIVFLLLALFAVSVVTVCVDKPRLALFLYLVALYFTTGLTNERVRTYGWGQLFTFLPPWVGYAGDGILAGLLIASIGKYFLGRMGKVPRIYDVLIMGLFYIAVLSWIVNSVPFFTAAAAIRLMVVMVSGYFVLRYGEYDLTFFETVFKVLWLISLVQFPIILFQRFIGVPILQWGDDLVTGTFSRYPKLITFQLVFFALGLAAYLQKSLSASFRRYMIWTAILAVGSMALSNSRIVFFFIPLLTAVLMFKHLVHRPILAIKVLVLVGLLFGTGLYAFVYLYGGPGSGGGQELLYYIQNPGAVYHYFFGAPEDWEGYGGRLSRGGAIVYLFQNLHRYPGGLWLGAGPGMASEFKYAIANTTRAEELVELGINRTQASAFLGELGLAGLVLSMLLIVVGFRLIREGHDYKESPYVYVIRQAYPAIPVLFLFMQFYSRAWFEAEAAFLFWFVTVYLLRAREEKTEPVLNGDHG